MPYDDLKKSELHEELEKRGLEYGSDDTNAELRDLLEADDAKPQAEPEVQEPEATDNHGFEPGSKTFVISCKCPTPLRYNPFTVTANTEADAVKRFKGRNGIVSSDHEIQVETK
jgi:hypothetical protein